MFDDFGFFLSVMLTEEDELREETEELEYRDEYYDDEEFDDEEKEDWDI